MELTSTEDLAALGAADLVRVSASIPRAAPRAFALTAILVVPLSFAVLAQSLLYDPILHLLGIQQADDVSVNYSDFLQWLLRFLAYKSLHILVLYTFAILSTAAAVFTVASTIYANKPASMSPSSFTALDPDLVLANLLETFSCSPYLKIAYHLVFELAVLLPMSVFFPDAFEPDAATLPLAFLLFVTVLAGVYLVMHVYHYAVWHLASVVTVLEPLWGLAALAKSKQLLQGRSGTAATLVGCYLAVCGASSVLFRAAVFEGRFGLAWPGRLLVGAVLLCLVVCVNLLGLLVQTVLYYACKAFHNL